MPLRRFSIQGQHVLRGLALGFLLVLLLLGAAGWVASRQSTLIRQGVEKLAKSQFIIARLIHDVQMAENAMTEVLHRVAQFGPGAEDPSVLLHNLDESERQLAQLSAEARAMAGGQLWADLDENVKVFTREVHRVLAAKTPVSSGQLESLFTQHDRVVSLVNELIRSSSGRLARAEQEIEQQSEKLRVDSTRLLGASLVLAIACALTTILFVRHSINRLQWQSGELDRVSWHMLQTQEQAARRFSHELHDELGQSLAAVRSNLTKEGTKSLEALRADCLQLVDQSIANVRELSQLLRPAILDDFGLEAGLQWLAEKFAERTRLNVDFTAANIVRYADETETHLFRIAQEALTNIARHARASRVTIRLTADTHTIKLVIEDNGQGLPQGEDAEPPSSSLGMVGMRARARQCGGEFLSSAIKPTGLRITVTVPVLFAEAGGEA
jgi:signal transduction histidine kinase